MIFNLEAGNTCPNAFLNGVIDVYGISKPGIRIDEDRNIATSGHVTRVINDIAQPNKTVIWKSIEVR